MALPHVSHVRGYLHNSKVSQDFEFADFDRGPSHEFRSKYQAQTFGHAGRKYDDLSVRV